jgi:hypothetical protein
MLWCTLAHKNKRLPSDQSEPVRKNQALPEPRTYQKVRSESYAERWTELLAGSKKSGFEPWFWTEPWQH